MEYKVNLNNLVPSHSQKSLSVLFDHGASVAAIAGVGAVGFNKSFGKFLYVHTKPSEAKLEFKTVKGLNIALNNLERTKQFTSPVFKRFNTCRLGAIGIGITCISIACTIFLQSRNISESK